MAVHACSRGGDVCLCRLFDLRMTVTAVHSQIASVDFVAEKNRLFRSIADVGVGWRSVIPKESHNACYGKRQEDQDGDRGFISPFREDLRQW